MLRLRPLAVNALAAAICRLTSHCSLRPLPENATAHATPPRSTTTAHISLLKPEVTLSTARSRAPLRACWLTGQPVDSDEACPHAAPLPAIRPTSSTTEATSRDVVFTIIFGEF